MGIFDKVKQFMNIGGVKLELLGITPDISREAGKFTGKVKLTSKSDQHVKNIRVKFERKITTYIDRRQKSSMPSQVQGMNNNEENNTKVREDVLGEWSMNNAFDMKAGETKEMDFEVKFHVPQTGGNISLGGGKINININTGSNKREDIDFTVNATADVDKAGFDPGDSVSVRLV